MSKTELFELQSRPYMNPADAENIASKLQQERKAEREALKKGQINVNPRANRRNRDAERFRSQPVVRRTLPLDGLNNAVTVPAKDRDKGRINIAGSGLTAADIADAIGEKHLSVYTSVEFNGIKHDQQQMVDLLKTGATDVGITKGEIPVDLLNIGLTAFSPLKMGENGVVKPEHPVTVVARIPRNKRK